MFKKLFVLMVFILGLLALEAQAAIINSAWVGGQSGDWRDANNWEPSIVPDNNITDTFDVTIDSNSIGVNEVLVWIGQERTINRLDCYGDVILIQGGPYKTWIGLTLTDVNGLTNYGEFSVDGIAICGNVTNSTGAEIEFEEADIKGNLDNLSGAEIFVECEVVEIDGNSTNAGVIVINKRASFITDGDFQNAGKINVYGGECILDTMDNNSTGIIQGFGILEAEEHPPLIQNKGQIVASGGMLTVFSEGPVTNTGMLVNEAVSTLNIRPAIDVNNQGLIEVNAGGGVAFDCNLVNDTNGVVELLGGTLAATTITQTADANFAGFGGITGDVVIEPNGIIELTGSTNIFGNVTVEGTLEISDGVTLITGQTVCNGTIHIKGGYLIPQGGLSGDCNIIWEPGLFTNPADFNIDGEVNFSDFSYFAETWLWQASWY